MVIEEKGATYRVLYYDDTCRVGQHDVRTNSEQGNHGVFNT